MDALRTGKAACPTFLFPAAGIEPAPSRLQRDALPQSHTGMSRARRLQSHACKATLAKPRLQKPAVGIEPTRSALRERCSACRASPANSASPAGVEPA